MKKTSSSKIKKMVKKLNINDKLNFLSVDSDGYNKTTRNIDPYKLRFSMDAFSDGGLKYPTPTLLGASFDDRMMKKLGEIVAKDIIRDGYTAAMTPFVNVKRSPYQSNLYDFISEDPMENGKMVASFVNGLNNENVNAIVKNFPFDEGEFARYTRNINVDRRALHEHYLKSFKVMLNESKPSYMMLSPYSVNHKLAYKDKSINSLVRKYYNFEGEFVADQGLLRNKSEILNNDLLFEFGDYSKNDLHKRLSNEELNSLDTKVSKILSNMVKKDKSEKEFNEEEYNEVLKSITAESIILQKNFNNILPIEKNEKFMVFGPIEDNKKVDFYDPDDKLSNKLLNNFSQVEYVGVYDSTNGQLISQEFNKAVRRLERRTKGVFIIELPKKYKNDRDTIRIDEYSRTLSRMFRYNPNIIVVIKTYYPVVFDNLDLAQGVIVSYIGKSVNEAIADTLSGRNNPSGRFPETWAKKESDIPIDNTIVNSKRDEYYIESLYTGYKFYEKSGINPLFMYGEGLSYSEFKITDLKVYINLRKKTVHSSITLWNFSDREATTPILLYATKPDDTIYQPKRELFDFTKVIVPSGKKKTVVLETPLSYLDSYELISHDERFFKGRYKFEATLSSVTPGIEKEINVQYGNIHPFSEREKADNGIEYVITENPYNKIEGNDFNYIDFFSIYQDALVDERLDTISSESLLSEFEFKETGLNASKKMITRFRKCKEDGYYTLHEIVRMIDEYPIRIINNLLKAYTDEELEEIFNYVNNGKKGDTLPKALGE